MARHVGPRGISVLHHFEQCRLKAYLDGPGRVPTIGWGTTRINGVPVKLGQTCTQEEADLWFAQDLERFEREIERLVKVPVTDHQFDALVCLIYNIGGSNFSGSTVRRSVNAGRPVTSQAWLAWNKVRNAKTKKLEVLRGLTRRRRSEYHLFTTGDVRYYEETL